MGKIGGLLSVFTVGSLCIFIVQVHMVFRLKRKFRVQSALMIIMIKL